jgi:hypothetical protein
LRSARDDDVLQKMQKHSKRQRQSKRRKRLKMRAPPLPGLGMIIYNDSNGIETYLVWKTGEQHRAVVAFFTKLLRKNGFMQCDPGKPVFVFVETREQMDAFRAFAQALAKALR